MKLINADRIQEEIKKCDGFAYDDYDKGMREGIRRALMRISEAKTVDAEEIQSDGRQEFAEWLEENSYKYIESFWQGHSIGEALEDFEKEKKNEKTNE